MQIVHAAAEPFQINYVRTDGQSDNPIASQVPYVNR
jgi:hypothetical protein